MLRHDNGHGILDREFRSGGTIPSWRRHGVDVMRQDIGNTRTRTPRRRRGEAQPDAGEDRGAVLEKKPRWLTHFFGLEIVKRLDHVEERIDSLEQSINELAGKM